MGFRYGILLISLALTIHGIRNRGRFTFLRPDSHRTRNATRNATQAKWDLLSSMGVFTLHASNIKGFAFQFASASRPVSCVN